MAIVTSVPRPRPAAEGFPALLVATRSDPAGIVRVALSGELCMLTAPRLDTVLRAAEQGRPRRVVVDLGGLTFCDSRGVAVLEAARHRLRLRDAPLVLVRPRPLTRRLLEVLGISQELLAPDGPPGTDAGTGTPVVPSAEDDWVRQRASVRERRRQVRLERAS